MLRRIYSCEAYYERVKLLPQPLPPRRATGEPDGMPICAPWSPRSCARGSGQGRLSYWKFVLTAATRYRHSFGAAMTLAVMGYHFQVMTERLMEME